MRNGNLDDTEAVDAPCHCAHDGWSLQEVTALPSPKPSPAFISGSIHARPAVPESIPPWPCYLNGEFTNLREAQVSVLDRGFLFGDAIYDVVPAYEGQPFMFEAHMARLARGLAEMRIPNPMERDAWHRLTMRLLAMHAEADPHPGGVRHQLVYFQITRGVAMREHAMLKGLAPNVFAMVNRMPVPTEAHRRYGVACITAEDFRWRKAHLKSTSLLGAVFSKQLSVDAGVADTIMFRNGQLSEASASNVWMVKKGWVVGVPRSNRVLEGVRYGLLESLCRDEGLPFELRELSRAEVFDADELILSSAVKELVPVVELDGRQIGDGTPGAVFARLYAAYARAVERDCTLRAGGADTQPG
ncbi:aminotransferase class IV [Variovorax fucosicus]|uniref:aminotransferase class IV n=1 Tax=Variovorax fucosicus TaxID=3053517 RepID=UPI0025761ECE|nr:aminotransferase class IV [Variovorax sp. J22G47]MDM0058818.1 aminotransferase class IV [Variovorax sp. J22G47]